MSDRITTTCQHAHTVTLRLEEGEWRTLNGHSIPAARIISGRKPEHLVPHWDDWWVPIGAWPAESEPRGLRADLVAAFAAAESSCGGCGCADRLRAEASRLAAGRRWLAANGHFCAADFLDAAPDARGEDT